MKTFTCPQTGITRDAEGEARAYHHRSEQIRLAAIAQRQAEIDRVCARFELESDEFYTREQKALRIMQR